jgi:hypothetical protein
VPLVSQLDQNMAWMQDPGDVVTGGLHWFGGFGSGGGGQILVFP